MIKFQARMAALVIAASLNSASIAASDEHGTATANMVARQPLLIAYDHSAARAAAKSQRQVRRRAIRRNENYRQKLRNDHRRYEQNLVRQNHH